MKKLMKMFKTISRNLSNMSLLRKLTLAYTISILIPTFIIGYYSYYQSMNKIKMEAIRKSDQSLIQMKADIERRITIIRGIADNIAYNTKIQNLLHNGMEFTPEALNYFTDSIAAPIDYALNFSDANIYKLGVYYVNSSIPEYNYFLREERIKNLSWYKGFKESKADEMWLYPFDSDLSNDDSSNDNIVLRMIKRISGIDGKFLGVVILDIKDGDVFYSMNMNQESNELFVVNKNNDIVFPTENMDTASYKKVLIYANEKPNRNFYYDNVLYNNIEIKDLNITIVNKVPLGGLVRNSIMASSYNIIVVIIGMILLEIITYFILKRIFSRLNQIVKIMNLVAKGNFDIRIPANHSDEVGLIAGSFNVLIEKINTLISDLIKKETSQRDAQLAALQYQINPHFIYNTIDIFRMKLELEGNYEMADSITYFGKMMRYNINQNSYYATISEEVDYIQKYLTLQKLRFKEKIKFEIEVSEDIKNAKIIRFMLQPIVENAFIHGLNEGNSEQLLRISFRKEGSELHISVFDNGRGISEDSLRVINQKLRETKISDINGIKHSSIGLENINNRIKLFYGEQYHIRLESVEGEYTNTFIKIPYLKD